MKIFYFVLGLFLSNVAVSQEIDTIFYNVDWQKTKNRDSFKFYRLAKLNLNPDTSYLVKDYYLSGQLQMQGQVKSLETDGRFGHFEYYDKNGNKESEGEYLKDKRHGQWKFYDSLKFLYKTEEYRNGDLDGLLKMYYSNGKLKRKEVYKADGFLRGECYDTTGEEIEFFQYEIMPEYPGGDDALMTYLQKKIKYPKNALKKEIEGIVMVRFVITPNGEVTDVKITKTVSPEIDEEALRVVRAMPKWKPGLQDNIPVPVFFDVPINFSLK
jgi:TonB family protein